MTALHGALIGLGFGCAVFAITLGIGGVAALWTERTRRRVKRSPGAAGTSKPSNKEADHG